MVLCAAWVWSGTWVWEVRITARQGAVRVAVPRNITSLGLQLEAGQTLSFLLAETPAAVQDYWTYRKAGSGQGVVACTGDPLANQEVTCAHRDEQLSLSFSLPAGAAERVPFLRERFLIPLHARGGETQGLPSVLLLKRVSWSTTDGPAQTLTPRSCVQPTTELASPCRLIESMLGRPAAVNRNDPQPHIVAAAAWAAAHLVPTIILSMLLADLALIILVARYLYRILRGAGLGRAALREQPEATQMLMHVDLLAIGWRRAFEYLEVTGPALGFLLTVGSLLLAFDPAIFSERDTGRFTQAMSLALTATFAGLLMRILAYSADKLLEQLLRMDADMSGFVSPAAPPRLTQPTEKQ